MQYNVKENLRLIQEEIVPYKPNIIAVTKYFDGNAIVEAYQAGLRNFGESRVIEATEKINGLPEDVQKNSKFHFIGHLQSNKARKAVARFDVIHSVDSYKLAAIISESASEIGKTQDILLQLNNANEVQKSGFSKEELFDSFEDIKKLPNLNILGLMNMAPLGAEEIKLRELFSDVKRVRDELEIEFACKLPELSMGMSQDYKIAVTQGATMLRIGHKLFS
ncbi:MAG: YggS family pyridoxal phosphate-dependent enzyme [Candidatus Gastranaerophilaceae bacterium]|jgi:pyridoxal phosphate enzyme (YggS family)|nr:YggS family pyridoxal phosphate-dependent enzyme [Candidatus Gastranaerophilaceae bacterium]